jgi:rhodanese-related sulfurtransferase
MAEDVQKMDKEELKSMLGAPELVLLDGRQGRDWRSSEFKIKGATRASSDDFDKWSQTLPKDKTIVLYCA